MNAFKNRLNEALRLRDMKPSDLARLTKINEASISEYRRGGYKATQKNLEKIAVALRVPIPWLMARLKIMPKNNLSYVFSDANGKPLTEQRCKRSWKSFLNLMDIDLGAKTERNKIILSVIDRDITPYYLRHSYATGLREAGVDIKTAQYLLGHADIHTTLQIYTHVTKNMIKEAGHKINSLA